MTIGRSSGRRLSGRTLALRDRRRGGNGGGACARRAASRDRSRAG